MTVTRIRLAPDGRREQLLELGVRAAGPAVASTTLSIDSSPRRPGSPAGCSTTTSRSKQEFHLRGGAPDGRRDRSRSPRPGPTDEPLEQLAARLAAYVDFVVDNHEAYVSLRAGRGRGRRGLPARSTSESRARADRPDLRPPPTRRCWRGWASSTPRSVRLVVRGWSALVEEWSWTGSSDPGHLPETLLEVLANALAGRRLRLSARQDSVGPVVYTSEFPFVYLTRRRRRLQPAAGRRAVGPPGQARAGPPYQGRWALPGGFVDENEDVEQGRPARAQGGDRRRRGRRPLLEQLGAYTAPGATPGTGSSRCPTGPPSAPDAEAAGRRRRRRRALAGRSPRRLAAKRLAFDHAHDRRRRLRARSGGRWRRSTLAGLAARRGVHDRRAARGLRGGVGPRPRPGQLPAQGARHPGLRRRQRLAHLRSRGRPGHALHPPARAARSGRRCRASATADARPTRPGPARRLAGHV